MKEKNAKNEKNKSKNNDNKYINIKFIHKKTEFRKVINIK